MPNIITRITRLLPLALLLAIPFPALAQQTTPPAQKWRQSQKPDSTRGINYTQFTLAGKFLKWPKGDASNRPTIEVDCTPSESGRESRRQFLHAYLLVGVPLKIKYVEPEEIKQGISYFPLITVAYAPDSNKPRREQWSPGPDKTSATIEKGALQRMLEADTVVISLDEDKAGEVTMQFDMPDGAALAETCDLPNRKK
jgi:hypothetical protein